MTATATAMTPAATAADPGSAATPCSAPRLTVPVTPYSSAIPPSSTVEASRFTEMYTAPARTCSALPCRVSST